jgi:chemotaxis response regulator CheB
MAIARELKQSDVFQWLICRDGIDAIEKIKSLKPDVVTLDVKCPKWTV